MRNPLLRGVFFLAVLGLSLVEGRKAEAGLLLGKTLQIDILYPNQATVYDYPSASQSVTVSDNPGPEYTFFVSTINISDRTIDLSFIGTGTFGTESFNGFHIFDSSGTIPDFKSVTITQNTLPGFDASRLSFNADEIWVNVSGLSFDPDYKLSLIVTPEPSTAVAGSIGGLIGLAGYYLRRRRIGRKNR